MGFRPGTKERSKDARCVGINPNRNYNKDENQTYREHLRQNYVNFRWLSDTSSLKVWMSTF